MSINIQIIREGIPGESTQLAPGEYVLGRGEACDIILGDNSVSKNHATLSVSSDGVTIHDSGSLNGIYYNGKRIEHKTFKGDFEIEIAPFILRAAFQKQRKKMPPSPFSLDALASSNIKPILFLSLIVVMVVTFIIIYFPLNNQVKHFREQEVIQRGIILARYLGEMNRYSMELGEYDLVRTDPIGKEEGVIYSFIVDVEGRILAPVENSGDFPDWPGLPNAMQEGKLEVSEGKKKEKIIFYPIEELDKTIGGAIIGYDVERAGEASGPDIKGASYLLLIVSLAVCGVLGKVLIRVFLRPLRRLEEEVSVSLKEGRDHVAFKSPYKEIDNLVRAFNRLLLRARTATADTPVESGTSSSNDVREDALDSGVSNLDEIISPWCVVDKQRHVIVQHSQSFSNIFGNASTKKGIHVAEVFDDPEVTNAVFELTDNPDGEGAVTLNREKPLKIKKTPIEGEENKVLFIFEESSNG